MTTITERLAEALRALVDANTRTPASNLRGPSFCGVCSLTSPKHREDCEVEAAEIVLAKYECAKDSAVQGWPVAWIHEFPDGSGSISLNEAPPESNGRGEAKTTPLYAAQPPIGITNDMVERVLTVFYARLDFCDDRTSMHDALRSVLDRSRT